MSEKYDGCAAHGLAHPCETCAEELAVEQDRNAGARAVLPAEWLKPGAVVPVTPETVRLLLDAVRGRRRPLVPCPVCGGEAVHAHDMLASTFIKPTQAEARQEQPQEPDSSYSAQPKGEEATERNALAEFNPKLSVVERISLEYPFERDLDVSDALRGWKVREVGPKNADGSIQYLIAERAALSSTPAQGDASGVRVDAVSLDTIPTSWELSYGSDDEEAQPEWRVHCRHGSVNDREWTLIGTGRTPSAAIAAARGVALPRATGPEPKEVTCPKCELPVLRSCGKDCPIPAYPPTAGVALPREPEPKGGA